MGVCGGAHLTVTRLETRFQVPVEHHMHLLAGLMIFFLQFLPKNVHIICVDMPGHGGTTRTSAVDYSIEGQVKRIHQVGHQ